MRGLDVFRAHFQEFAENYILIGGSACFIILGEAGLKSRATKDLDIIILAEALNPEFGHHLWQFIEEGGYAQRLKGNGEQEFYRFLNPSNGEFPEMLEIFTRRLVSVNLPQDAVIGPLPISESVASLSAILLDDEYYEVLKNTSKVIDGITVLDEKILIPFKAKAYTNLRETQESGEQVHDKDVRKHRNDVFRLLQLLPDTARVELSKPVRNDLLGFIERLQQESGFDPRALKIPGTLEEHLNRIRLIYDL